MNKILNKLSINLKKRYILALSLMALILFVSQGFLQYSISNQREDGSLINIAGRQRMLSQKLVKNVLYYDYNKNIYPEIESSLNELTKAHKILINKDNYNLDFNIKKLDSSFKKLVSSVDCFLIRCTKNKNTMINNINTSSNDFLKIQNNYVKHLENILYKKVSFLSEIEYLFLIIGLFGLFLEFLFILKPSLSYIKETLLNHEVEQAEVRKLYKRAELGDLSNSIFHEIKNNLAVIKFAIFRLDKEELQHNKLNKLIKNSVKSINNLESLVLSANKIARENEIKENISIITVLEDYKNIMGDLLKSNNVKLKIDNNFNTLININSPQILQVLLNLTKNSIDAISSLEEKYINIKTTEDDASLILAFQDSGHGISDDISNSIFEPYFTTKGSEKGTGLGMSITKKILEDHGAQIHYEKINGHTTFILTFPKVQELTKVA